MPARWCRTSGPPESGPRTSRSESVQDALDRLVSDWAGHSHVHEVVLCIDFDGQRWSACAGHWQGGPVTPRTPHFIASTSKLFATAMLLSLQEDRRLSLDDPVAGFFGQGELAGLHRWRGQDLTGQITLRHLLAHRSGLPDYFEGKRLDGSRFAERLLAGHDLSYGWPQVLHWTRE